MTIIDNTADVTLFTAGRTPGPVLAVVLHQFCSGIEMLDLEMERCPRPRPAQSPGCHTSFHYGVDGCIVHQYVDTANTAWGFGVIPPTCPQPECALPECASCTGLTVAQYNTDLDGNAPTIPGFTAGADGTANNQVIHIALTGSCSNDAMGCCSFLSNPQTYNCIVKSLCAILSANDITPTFDTFLVHCEELPCLDIVQLIADIIACQETPPPVLPPCSCVPTAEQLCTALGTFDTDDESTSFVLGIDCLWHPTADAFVVEGSDTDTVDITVTESPANTFTVEADVIVSPDAENIIEARANGLYATRGPLVVAAILNAGVIDPTSGTDVYIYSGPGAGAVTLTNPTAGEKNDLWVKNVSPGATLTITAASNIDGVGVITLDGTTGGTYPFGNNGGEAVHLVWTGSTWNVL